MTSARNGPSCNITGNFHFGPEVSEISAFIQTNKHTNSSARCWTKLLSTNFLSHCCFPLTKRDVHSMQSILTRHLSGARRRLSRVAPLAHGSGAGNFVTRSGRSRCLAGKSSLIQDFSTFNFSLFLQEDIATIIQSATQLTVRGATKQGHRLVAHRPLCHTHGASQLPLYRIMAAKYCIAQDSSTQYIQ